MSQKHQRNDSMDTNTKPRVKHSEPKEKGSKSTCNLRSLASPGKLDPTF